MHLLKQKLLAVQNKIKNLILVAKKLRIHMYDNLTLFSVQI
jgi:hypothetical protein